MLGSDADKLRARGVLDVERQRQQRVTQVAVKRCERPQVAEIEVDVLPVALAADALVEQDAVGCQLEVVGAVGEVGGGLVLGAEVERDALRFEVGNLLVNCEHGLALLGIAAFRHSPSFRSGVRKII